MPPPGRSALAPGNAEAPGAARPSLHLVHRVAQAGELLAQLAHRRDHPDHRLAHALLVALALEQLVQLAQGVPRGRGHRPGLGDLEREHGLAARLKGGRVAPVELRPVVEIELVSLVGCVVHPCLRMLPRARGWLPPARAPRLVPTTARSAIATAG